MVTSLSPCCANGVLGNYVALCTALYKSEYYYYYYYYW